MQAEFQDEVQLQLHDDVDVCVAPFLSAVAFDKPFTKAGSHPYDSAGFTRTGVSIQALNARRNDSCCWMYAALKGVVSSTSLLPRRRSAGSMAGSAVQ